MLIWQNTRGLRYSLSVKCPMLPRAIPCKMPSGAALSIIAAPIRHVFLKPIILCLAANKQKILILTYERNVVEG